MRALAVSSDAKRIDEISAILSGIDQISSVATFRGSLVGQVALPAKGDVDVLFLDCISDPEIELPELERLLPLYPQLTTVILTAENSPDVLLRALRMGVKEVISQPLAADEFAAALRRIDQRSRTTRQTRGKVLAFVSCKGGSGATFLATNLAFGLADAEHKRVLLIDMNLQFGDAALFVSDRRPPATLADLAHDIQRVDAALLESSVIEVLPNFGILCGPDDPTQAIDIKPAHIDRVVRLARTQYDYVVLDMGRNIDGVAIQALDAADYIFPVLQLTLPFVRDGKRLIRLFQTLDYGSDKVRPIVNRLEKSPDLKVEDLERALGIKVFATVPNHYPSAAASVNQGIPVIKLARNSPISRALLHLTKRVGEPVTAAAGGFLSRLFGRSGDGS
ncbi:MAG: AAA family ATPase [Burkholderiales bacterium]|nr:MAG: AAA family ATPase [Burkholderiales bacterium]